MLPLQSLTFVIIIKMEEMFAYPNDHIVTVGVMQYHGLRLSGLSERQLRRAKDKTNKFRFNSAFGALPAVLCSIYEDLNNSTAFDDKYDPPRPMRLKASKINFTWFLRTVLYLRKYPTEDDFERNLNINIHHGRDKIWNMVRRIQLLQFIKITWPDELGGNNIWIMSVDGTHCWIAEPGHPNFSQDSEYYSHKFNKAGINYELGIALATGKLIWMNGPFKAGRNDLNIFTQEGLEERLRILGKKSLGDGGYAGHHETVSSPNAHDSYQVKRFKSRGLKRQEDFNGMTKVFNILKHRFRHPLHKFPVAFEAVCVICQYKIESDEPLYDILVEALLNEPAEDIYDEIGIAW